MQPCAVCLLEQGAWTTWPCVVPANLSRSVSPCVHVLSPSCDERHKSARNAVPSRRPLFRWACSGGAERSSCPSSAASPRPPLDAAEAGPARPLARPAGGAGAAWPGCSSACSGCTAACSPAMRPAAPCTDTACSAAWPRPAWPAWPAASRVRRGGPAGPGEGSVAAGHTQRARRLLPCCPPRFVSLVIPREGGRVSCPRVTAVKALGCGPLCAELPQGSWLSLGPEQGFNNALGSAARAQAQAPRPWGDQQHARFVVVFVVTGVRSPVCSRGWAGWCT